MTTAVGKRPWLIVGVLAVIAFGLSLVVAGELFPHLSPNNDEPVYVLQAQTFRSGHVTLSASAHDDFFRPWMSGRRGDHLFLVVQPVLPAILAVSEAVFGSMRDGLGLIAAGAVVAVFLCMRELLDDQRVALTAAALFVLSPLVVVQSALYLSYLLAVALSATVITLVSRGLRERVGRAQLAVSGLVLGVLLFTRPIEGLLLGTVLVVWVLARDGVRQLRRAMPPIVVGLVPVVGLMLVYNRVTTGSLWRFPLWAIGGNDSFGFGDRWIVAGAPIVHYDVGRAWLALRTNLGEFPHWLFGGLVTLPLMGWGARRLWKTNRSVLILLGGLAVIYPAGYFLYWGNYLIMSGRHWFGPHYYLEVLIPATALTAVGAVDLARRRSSVAVLTVVLLIAGTALEVRAKIDANLHNRDVTNTEVAAVHDNVHQPAVVILPVGRDGPWLLHPRGAFANPPDLNAATLFAADLQGRNGDLFDRFPDRSIFRFQEVDSRHGRRPDLRRLQRVRAHEIDVTLTATPRPDQPYLTAYSYVSGEFGVCHLTDHATPGTSFQASAQLSATTITLTGCDSGTVTVPMPTVPSTIAIGFACGPRPDPTTDEQTEQRYWTRPFATGVEIITPPDTWHRFGPGTNFDVGDPNDGAIVNFHTNPV